MGTNERRERERLELRTKILDAARELFVRHGYEAVTMRKIAQRIEYSPTALYLHFADKETLVRELCVNDFRAFAERFARLMTIVDPIERLQRAGQAYVEFAIQHPNQYRLMFMTPMMYEGKEKDLPLGNPEEDAYAFLKWNVEEVKRTGLLRPELGDVETVAQLLWSAVHGIVSLWIAKKEATWVDFRDPERLARLMTETLIRGITKD
jgi:AcrR family transcriptional regulator